MGGKLVGVTSLFFLFLMWPAVAAAQPTPAGWWRLDGNAEDSSRNNNHGTAVGNPEGVAGKFGRALALDGVDDCVDCGNPPSLNLTGELTVTAWVYPTGGGGGGYGRILDKSTGTGGADPGYKFYLCAGDNYVVTLSVGGGNQNTSARLVLNTWNFMAFVATGTQWKLYFNGVWQEWPETALPTVVPNPLFLGNSSTGVRHFDGMMDEVRLYNRALTPAEIAWLAGRTTPFDLPF